MHEITSATLQTLSMSISSLVYYHQVSGTSRADLNLSELYFTVTLVRFDFKRICAALDFLYPLFMCLPWSKWIPRDLSCYDSLYSISTVQFAISTALGMETVSYCRQRNWWKSCCRPWTTWTWEVTTRCRGNLDYKMKPITSRMYSSNRSPELQ